jgi:hypothetical protein
MNAQLAYPNELKFSAWEKDKKAGFAASSDVADKLKSLQKKHDAVNWKLFEPGWSSEPKSAAELQEAFALRDRLYRSSVFALKKEALGVASAAKAEEKKAAKPWLDTLKAIGKSANGYADEVDAGADALKAAFDKAASALPDDEEDAESAPKALVDPKVLAKQLKLCKNDPDRVMRFAFIDAKGEQPAIFAMHPRMSAKKMFSTLQAATGIKSGAFGSAWVQVDGEFRGTCLMLQLDKPLSGLVKKVKAPVKAAGFKIAKAVLWNEDGTVFEQEDEVDDGAAATGAGAASTAVPTPPQGQTQPAATAKKVAPEMEALMARAAAVATKVAAAGDALDPSKAKDAKLRASEALLNGRKADWERADALMKQAEAILAGVKAMSGAASAPAEPTATATATGTTSIGDDAPMARGTAKAPPIDALVFRNRLTAMVPRMKPVEAAGGEAAAQLKAKRDEAVALVRQKGAGPAEFAKAGALLDEIDVLIGGAEGGAAFGAAPKVAAATGAKVVFQQTRLAWDSTRKQVQAELRKLEEAILAQSQDQPDLQVIAEGTKNLYKILDHLDERLIDKLDDALSAASPDERNGFHQEARKIVDEYLDYLKGEELFDDIDDNGFVPVAIASTLNASLGTMARQLDAAVTA